MKTGRPPKDADLNDLHGDPGNRNQGKPKDEKISVSTYRYLVPKHLKGKQKKYVKMVADELYTSGKSRLEYQAIFDGFCQHLYLRDKAFEELVDAENLVIKGERGIDKKHPAIQTHKDFSASMLKHAEHLGISGLTADRVKGVPKKEADPLTEYMGRGKK